MPLGIAVAVLGAVLLVLHAATRSHSKPGSAPARTRRHRIQENVKESLASELALLAELHAQGALTPEEFVAAKRRVLGI
ncbi:SHOCT domain-containing protein [Arthrobacter sp. W4I7]|uniref:SHOCT domain-containing protein n=1 Tax=Arthrobacter sp. W4I7 TaxID=3042296 RepID=UPI00358EB5E9